MIVETHIIQNVAPANLNRDATGAPKATVFGGVPRARISSQALKRAARLGFVEAGLSEGEVGFRTREAVRMIGEKLVERLGVDYEDAQRVADTALQSIGLKIDKGKVAYLLFLGSDAIEHFTERVAGLYDKLSEGKKLTKVEKDGLSSSDLFDAAAAADVALFGRMVADLPIHNVDAACQVAHAISTHQVTSEIDYFTAVDDDQAADETGAGHIGELEFNSSCFYRYSAIHVDQLVQNLDGDIELAVRAVAAYLRSTSVNLPSGKQNSMAAFNPPSLIAVVLRKAGQWNLANAFASPVRSSSRADLISESCSRLVDYYATLAAAFPGSAPTAVRVLPVGVELEPAEGFEVSPNLESLVAWLKAEIGALLS